MKQLICCLLIVVLSATFVFSAEAENGAVHYDGESRSFIFEPGSKHSPTDLFDEFKDVMPGDTIHQKITVKNDASKKVKVKIYLRALGAHADSEAFLSELKLTVQKATNTPMFSAAASETASLTDWYCLGTLYSGGEVDLNVLLEAPTSLDTSFEKAIGFLDWEFKVEEFPIEKGDPATGEPFPYGLVLAAVLATLSLVVLLWLLLLGKRKNKHRFN